MSTGLTIAIPARYASTRFPGKPLARLAGKEMILHTCDRATEAGADRVVVATDDDRIASVCRSAGVTVVMTRRDHPSGTDRLAEVVERLRLPADEIVVNLQGDEPLMPPAFIREVHRCLAASRGAVRMATLVTPLTCADDLHNPNIVKAVVDREGYALYFSRAPIPWQRETGGRPVEMTGWYRHLGLYAYRASFLEEYPSLSSPWLEQMEALEQLRALWHGERILTTVVSGDTGPGVDSPEQLAVAESLLRRR